MLDRRAFLALMTAAPIVRCASRSEGPRGRITSRPRRPESEAKAGAAPLIVMLHGAGGRGERARRILEAQAERESIVLVAPDSVGRTWDGVSGRLGPDVERIDALLAETFARSVIDPKRIAVAGFSDGATYALTLGLGNGDLFTHTIAFSPGFLAVAEQSGRPQVFISHGRADEVLPVVHCSRRIVPRIEGAGYRVRYREFDGGHAVPPEIAEEAVAWFLRR